MLLIVSMTTTKRKQANANKYDFLKKKNPITILNIRSDFKRILRHTLEAQKLLDVCLNGM